MSINFDTSQVDRLAMDLTGAPKRVQFAARKTMRRTALEVKKGMGRDFSGHSRAPHLDVRAFEFEQRDALGLSYEIGELDSGAPGTQWGLAGIFAFGTSNGGPVVDHTAALRKETPVMLHHLGVDAEDATLGGAE